MPQVAADRVAGERSDIGELAPHPPDLASRVRLSPGVSDVVVDPHAVICRRFPTCAVERLDTQALFDPLHEQFDFATQALRFTDGRSIEKGPAAQRFQHNQEWGRSLRGGRTSTLGRAAVSCDAHNLWPILTSSSGDD